MASPIENNAIYITSPDTGNEFYNKLSKALQGKHTSESTIQIKTAAGDFFISVERAQEQLAILKRWDKADDPVSEKSDNKILGVTFYQKVSEGVSQNKGFKIDFVSFTPSKTWLENFTPLEHYLADNHLLFNDASKTPFSPREDLWRFVTLATLSGFTPRFFEDANKFCNPGLGCSLFMFLSGTPNVSGIPSISPDGKITQQVFWPVSEKIYPEDTPYTFTHERIHGVHHKAAYEAGFKTFTAAFNRWAKDQEKYKASYTVYDRVYKTAGGQERFSMAYVLEESTDMAIIRQFNPKLIAVNRARTSKYDKEYIYLPQADFNRAAQNAYPSSTERAVYLALKIHVARSAGVNKKDTDLFYSKAETLLKQDPNTLELFKATLVLMQGAEEYVSTPAMKQIIAANIPAVMKS